MDCQSPSAPRTTATVSMRSAVLSLRAFARLPMASRRSISIRGACLSRTISLTSTPLSIGRVLLMTEDQFPHYIEFRHVYKTFDNPVLVDSNFYIDGGQTVAIIGRSGVGKSVTLAHIMGFLRPDRGRVIVAHEDITDLAESELRRIRKKVTMVFQSGALFDSMTVAE